jgi:hypothetical protein
MVCLWEYIYINNVKNKGGKSMNWKIVAICILVVGIVVSPSVLCDGNDAAEVWIHRYPEYDEKYDLDDSGDVVSTDVSIAYLEGIE